MRDCTEKKHEYLHFLEFIYSSYLIKELFISPFLFPFSLFVRSAYLDSTPLCSETFAQKQQL